MSIPEEQYAWVDILLNEHFYKYALTGENYEEFARAGLFNERWDWVDWLLEAKELAILEGKVLMRAPLSWVGRDDDDTSFRKRSSSDAVSIVEMYKAFEKEKEEEVEDDDVSDITMSDTDSLPDDCKCWNTFDVSNKYKYWSYY
jgi:hypothetical protein